MVEHACVVPGRRGAVSPRAALAAVVVVVLGWAGATSGTIHVADLEGVVGDAAARSGLSLELVAGPCEGLERIALKREYCVRHDLHIDARRWGADLGMRRWVAANAMVRSLESHPRLVSETRYPSTSFREPRAAFVLEYPEGLLDVRVAPTRPYQAAVTFWPRDPIGPCLRANVTTVDLLELARSFHTFDTEQVHTLLACTSDTGSAGPDGRTALFEAVSADDAAAVKALLAAGWRHDHRDDAGWTALLLAAQDATDPAVVTALLAAGADPTIGTLEAPWRDALWHARRNDHLAGSEAVIALIADFIRRTSVYFEPLDGPREIASGTAPFLPPTLAPADVEALLLSGTMTLRMVTAATGAPGARAEFAEDAEVQIDFELVHWVMPLILDGAPYVATFTYTQRLEVTAPDDSALLDGLTSDTSDDFWFELVDVRDGTLGETWFAIADDLDAPSVEAALDLVSLRGLLVGAGVRVPPDARIGVGAEWVTERRIDLESGELVWDRRESVADVGEATFTIDASESVLLPCLTLRDDWIETVTSLRQEMTYRSTVRPFDRVRASVHGDLSLDYTLTLRVEGDEIVVSITASGPFEATLEAVNWQSLSSENRQGVVRRMVRLIERHL